MRFFGLRSGKRTGNSSIKAEPTPYGICIQTHAYTFWDYFRNAYARDAGLRIDHFLLSSRAAARLSKAEVDKHVRGWERTSDHAPVWIELTDETVLKRRTKAGPTIGERAMDWMTSSTRSSLPGRSNLRCSDAIVEEVENLGAPLARNPCR